jgi:hypothetical protein
MCLVATVPNHHYLQQMQMLLQLLMQIMLVLLPMFLLMLMTILYLLLLLMMMRMMFTLWAPATTAPHLHCTALPCLQHAAVPLLQLRLLLWFLLVRFLIQNLQQCRWKKAVDWPHSPLQLVIL